jgi:uncharacterized protein with NRDE domain
MCVLSFAWRVDDRWPLVLIGNRDERHERPTLALDRWADAPILAGRDILSGGTWLGVSDLGLAVVTNYSTGRIATGPSRGALVPDFLHGRVTSDIEAMNPFNLLTFGAEGAAFVSNYPEPVRHALAPGIHALANAGLDEPVFRAESLQAALASWLAEGSEPEALLTPLTVRDAPDGVTPVFIRDPVYGTRCGTVVAVDALGRGTIVERRFDADGGATGESSFAFRWPFIADIAAGAGAA